MVPERRRQSIPYRLLGVGLFLLLLCGANLGLFEASVGGGELAFGKLLFSPPSAGHLASMLELLVPFFTEVDVESMVSGKKADDGFPAAPDIVQDSVDGLVVGIVTEALEKRIDRS